MTEVVLAATLLLLVTTTLTGITIQLTGRTESLDWLTKEGYDVLQSADYGNILRPAVFLYGITENDTQQVAVLEAFLKTSLPFSSQFSLSRISITDGIQEFLIDHGSAQSQGADGVLVSYLLSNWEDRTWGSFNDGYIVRLELWIEI